MIIEAGGNHAESEDDTGGSPDIEAQLPTEEIREGAEDESSEDEADHGESVEVRHHHRLKSWKIFHIYYCARSVLTSPQTQLFSVTAVSLNSEVSYSHWEQATVSALSFTSVFLFLCFSF